MQGVAFIALAHSRALHIIPISFVMNLTRPKERRISKETQVMLWWSGLRGGVAFALSVHAAELHHEDGKYMETATFLICVATVLFNGGLAPRLLGLLQLLKSQQELPLEVPRAGAPALAGPCTLCCSWRLVRTCLPDIWWVGA